jgi:hypothetical protein
MTLVGYDELTKGYRCLDYRNKKIIISRDVLFDETRIGIPDQKETASSLNDILRSFLEQNSETSSSPSSSHLPTMISSPVPHPLSPSLPIHLHSPSVLPNQTYSTNSFGHLNSESSPLSISPLVPPLSSPSPVAPRRSSHSRQINVRLEDYILSITPDDYDIYISHPLPNLDGDNLSLDQAL